jgi:ABC-2 type transport system ATP-binding protein
VLERGEMQGTGVVLVVGVDALGVQSERGAESFARVVERFDGCVQLLEVPGDLAVVPGDHHGGDVTEVLVQRGATDASAFGDVGHGDGQYASLAGDIGERVEDGVVHLFAVLVDGRAPQSWHASSLPRHDTGHYVFDIDIVSATVVVVIRVDQLVKTYDGRKAVDGLSFEAPTGAVTGFLGPNGAGKTTTFRMLLGLAEPTSGTAVINGLRYRDLADPRRAVGAVLESTGLHPGRTGRDHLRVIATAAGIPDRRADELLEMVGLSSAAGRRVGGYSLGMRQRLSLATAVLGDPGVIILDEPTNGLDPEGVSWLRDLIREWAGEGRCVVIASHLLAEVAQAVDRVVIISDGRVVHEGATGEEVEASIRVRSADPTRLAELLAMATSANVRLDGSPDVLVVDGIDARTLGDVAAQGGVAVYELTSTSPAEQLESLFLSLTTKERP